MDVYSTHIPILEELFKANNIKTVFEFGTGLYSTKLFSENCDSVISCEMQSEEWFDKVSENFSNYNNVSIECLIGPTGAIDHLSQLNKRFDMIFVDGHGATRWHAINVASEFTDLIVSHDTETPSYNWHLINLEGTWIRTDHRGHVPWTSVWRKK